MTEHSPTKSSLTLYSQLAKDLKCDVVYKTPNVFATSRFIYFFEDSPHLMKTARNFLYNSGYGSRSRNMWNNGHYLIFRHIADLFYSDQEYALHTLPKLTMDHIVLTSHTVMLVLQESGDEKVLVIARFCGMMNDFFDCTNVCQKKESIYQTIWITWWWEICMASEYLPEVLGWLEAKYRSHPGNFSADERGGMFLSLQTYARLKISVYCQREAIQFLLEVGFQYVLSERFMQKVLEDYFGHQRSKGGRSDNPTAVVRV